MKICSNEDIYRKKRKKENIVETIKLFAVILIGLVVIYNVTLIIQSVIDHEKTPSFLGIKTFTIISGSMKPTINEGDIVVTKNSLESDLIINDIITFRKGNEMITHRITKIESVNGRRKFLTKGDNNETTDSGEIYFNDIEGKVVFVIPHLGKLAIFFKNKISIIVIILIFFFLYMSDLKIQNKKTLRKKKKELLNKRRE